MWVREKVSIPASKDRASDSARERERCLLLLSLSLTDCLGRPFTRAFTLHARRERQEKQGRKGWKRIREPHHVHTREKKRFPFPFSPASGFSLSLEQTIASRERGFTNICFSLFLLPSSSLLSCAKTRCKAHPSASVALSHAYAHTQTQTHTHSYTQRCGSLVSRRIDE